MSAETGTHRGYLTTAGLSKHFLEEVLHAEALTEEGDMEGHIVTSTEGGCS